MNWLHYLLEANIYLCIFYSSYHLFLSKETYHTFNRLYLLFSCIVSFLLPVIQIGALKPTQEYATTITFLPIENMQHNFVPQPAPATNAFAFTDLILYFYLSGIAFFVIMLLLKLIQLVKMIKNNNKLTDDGYKLIAIEGSNTAFSFFNYLFIGTKTPRPDIVTRHELVHIRQKHSIDILFVELVKIINWFNPIIYLLQINLKTVHEYIADEQTAVHETDAISYSSFLVNNAYGLDSLSITHSFFNYNLLKRRIIMLNQKRSGSLTRLKYLVAAPICGALLCASTLGFSKNYGWVDLAPGRTSIHANVAEPGSATGTRIVKTTDVQVTSKGYKYHETGYLMNGKTNYRVIITEKNGDQKAYFKNTVTAAEIKLLKDKYGYKFPDMQLFSKLPTQPPAAPAGPEDPAKINEKLAPPPPGAPVSPSKVGEKLAPPPPVQPKPVTIADVPLVSPSGNSFDSLYKYIAKYTRYPAKARTNLVSGRLFVRFTVKDGKIADVKIARPLDPEIDGEVLRVIKNFDGALDPALSNCSLPVLFTIFDSQGKPLRNTLPAADDKKAITIRDTPADAAKVDHSKLYMLNEVVVATYL